MSASNAAQRIISTDPIRETVLPTDSADFTTSYGPMIQGVQKLATTRVAYPITTAESRNGATQYYAEISALNCDIIKKNANSIIKISGTITGEVQEPWSVVYTCVRYNASGVFSGEVGSPDPAYAVDGAAMGFATCGIYNDSDYDSTGQSIGFTLIDTAATAAAKWTYRIRVYSYVNTLTYVLNGTAGDAAGAGYERFTSQILVEEYQSADYVQMPRIVTFESSGTWNIPDGVTQLRLYGYAGGGGGGGGSYASGPAQVVGSGGGGGGSGARSISTVNVSSVVSPNRTLTITVGGGGAAAPTPGGGGNGTTGSTGGTTSVTNPTLGTLVSLAGGTGGGGGINNGVGGSGGSGYYGGGGGSGSGAGGVGGSGTGGNGLAGQIAGVEGVNGGYGGYGGFGGRGQAVSVGYAEDAYSCTSYQTVYRCGGGGGGGPGGGTGSGPVNTGTFAFVLSQTQTANGIGIHGAGGGGGGGGTITPVSGANNYCGGPFIVANQTAGAGAQGSVTIVYR